ncbi:hypothetical protein MMC30_000477 [Trapelia coarctata]|nr:hypothetical protein [Trapelia coarctata]
MAHRVHPEQYFIDPHLPDRHGPMPAWGFTQHGKLDKEGRRNLAFVWPRDKGKLNKPLTSWRRWKDAFTNKGPDIWVGREGKLEPNRPLWSNWMDEDSWGFGFDNLLYRDNRKARYLSRYNPNRKYDFKKRKYGPPKEGVWSDVKWDRERHPRTALYTRDHLGAQTKTDDVLNPLPGNPFEYDSEAFYWNWGRQDDDGYYYGIYNPGAPLPFHPAFGW